VAHVPASANSGQQDGSYGKRELPKTAESMRPPILLLRRTEWLRRRQIILRRSVDRGKKAVASARESFDKAGIFGGVAESVPKSFYCSVKAMVEVYKRVDGPKAGLQLLASDDLAGAFQEESQNLEGLVLEFHL
jgi:hypothetical protein